MAKTIMIFRDLDGNPISDSIAVQLKGTLSPFTEYNGTLLPIGGNSNGTRIFNNVGRGEYNIRFDTVVQSDISPIYVEAISPPINATIGIGSVHATNIADASIQSQHIATNAITNDKIADDAVQEANILDGSITGAKILDNAVTKTKLASSGIFSTNMADVSGWGPKIKSTLFGWNSGELDLLDGAIVEDKIADDAVTTSKLLDAAITSAKINTSAIETNHLIDGAIVEDKIANGAIVEDKIANDAVTTSKLLDAAITGAKINTSVISTQHLIDGAVTSQKIQDESVTLEKVSSNFKNTFINPPNKTLWVSSQFADNIEPYFDNVQSAIDCAEEIGNDYDTIMIYPGTYTQPLTINSSISLIGLDKTKCIIDHIPDSSNNATIDVIGIGGSALYIQNLTIRAISQNINAVNSIGLRIDGTSGKNIHLKDLIVIAEGKDDNSLPRLGIGIQLGDAEVVMTEIYSEGIGGAHTSAGTGADGYGIYINHANLTVGLQRCNLVGTGGQSTGTNGKGHGVKLTVNPTIAPIIEKSTIESSDESIFGDVVTAPRVFSTQYNVAVNANIQSTNFVDNAQSSVVRIKKQG